MLASNHKQAPVMFVMSEASYRIMLSLKSLINKDSYSLNHSTVQPRFTILVHSTPANIPFPVM